MTTRVGNYELLGTLGNGAMGTVHRARHAASGREVALKIVRVADDLHAKRLMREAELASRLDHPGIVKVLDAGRHGPVVFVAFELIEGARPLDQVLPGLDQKRRVSLIRDVARALGHAHQRGVVHRDVKAANVLVDVVGCPRLTDFGIGTSSDLDRLTRSGALVGTPRTMAPEQAGSRRHKIGPQTDVWAVGVMLHEALTDEHPVFGKDEPDSIVEVLSMIAGGAERGPRDVDPRISEALDRLVRRALAFEPEERFADGEAMAQALDEALAQGRRRGHGSERRAWTTPQLAIAVVALLGVGGAGGLAVSGALRSESAPAAAAPPPAPAAPTVEAPPAGVSASALLERARGRATAAPAEAARDLREALRLDSGVDAREAALVVAYAHAAIADDAALQAALALAPGDVAAEAWIALSGPLEWRGRGRSARALAALERAHERAASPVMRGEVLVRLGRYTDAATVLRASVDDAVVGPAARLWLVRARQGEAERREELTTSAVEESVELLDQVIARDPTLAQAWLHRGKLRSVLRDHAGAKTDLERACELVHPVFAPEVWRFAGHVQLADGKWELAGSACSRALELDPAHYAARVQRGLARLGAEDWRAAIDDFERCDREVPDDPEVVESLIEAHLGLGERSGVRAMIERLGRLTDDPATDAWCAGALAEIGDLAGAEAGLAALLDGGPALDLDVAVRALALRVRVRIERGDGDGALAAAKLLLELSPDSLSARTAMALACVATRDPQGAQRQIEAGVQSKRIVQGDAACLFIADAWSIHVSGGDLRRALELIDAGLTSSSPPYALGLAVRVLIRRGLGDLDGARVDARALLARMAEAPHDAWTVRVAREALGS